MDKNEIVSSFGVTIFQSGDHMRKMKKMFLIQDTLPIVFRSIISIKCSSLGQVS